MTTTTTPKTTSTLEQFNAELLKNSGATHQTTKPQRFIHTQRYFTMLRTFANRFKIAVVLSFVIPATFIQPNAAVAGRFTPSCSDDRKRPQPEARPVQGGLEEWH